MSPDEIGVSTVTVYELFVGIERFRDPPAQHTKVERFLAPLHIVNFDGEAARHAGKVRAQLERAGSLIGAYDLLLAGHALALDVTLVTRNTGEFARVRGLRTEDWEG